MRWLLGLLFAATAVGKLLDNRGFAGVLFHYQLLPEPALLGIALAISLSELVLGGMFLARYRLIAAAGAGTCLNFGYTLLAVLTNWRGIHLENCGCFGVFFARPMTWGTVVEDVVLTAVSATYWRLAVLAERSRAA